MTHSPYLQSYNVPIAGDVPPLHPSIYNDEFTAQHPAVTSGPGAGGYVIPDAKWFEWDPGNVLALSYIDPRFQMLQLSGVGEKEWGGRFQALPVPLVGAPVQYYLYVRALNAYVNTGGNFTDQLYGMCLAEDLADDPDLSVFYSLHARVGRVGGEMFGDIGAAEWAGYDSVAAPDGSILSGWPLQYFRARVASSFDGTDYATSIRFEASADGIGWQPVHRYEGLTHAIRHVALAQRCTGETDVSTYFDFIRYEATEIGVLTAARFQHLGSV